MRITTFLLLLVSMPLLADYPLEIIELNSRPVEEIIPIIKPFINSDGSVSGMRNQLIVRTSTENLREIQKILDRIDRPPRRLMIYVRSGTGDELTRRAASADINALVGNDAKVVIGQAAPGSSVRYRSGTESTRSDQNVTQQVQTLDGRQTFIATGRQVPIRNDRVSGWSPRPYPGTTVAYQDATAGFYVLPRLNGNQVSLTVSPQMVRKRVDRGFDVSRASTTLTGRLGEWITLGGVSSGGYADSSRIGSSAGTVNAWDGNVSLRVEELK